MKCVYCQCVFKLNSFTKSSNVCPECDGTLDDLTIPDSELQIEILSLRNPTGRTKPEYIDEDEE
jgi:hypothetical protein